MRFFLALTFLSLSIAKSETLDGARLFADWAAAVDAAYEDRPVRFATRNHEFTRFVTLLPQTKQLLAMGSPSKAEIIKALEARYKLVLGKNVEMSESDYYLGLLYCSLTGLDSHSTAGVREAGTYNLDRSLGKKLFGITVQNPWKILSNTGPLRESGSNPFAE